MEKNNFAVENTCSIPNVSKSNYYDWLKRKDSKQVKSAQKLDERIRGLFGEQGDRFGYLRIHQELLISTE
ncbi:Uncharacterized protein XB16_0297 [Leptospira santarosai]|uniref:Uncharacterized protein n=1 Tax=Leptospira santarosai TaxID=28183 RepID=A0A2P1QP17_9LEPT|nr:Uncharacterized protein XB16_0297 [Leptospira santarosai]